MRRTLYASVNGIELFTVLICVSFICASGNNNFDASNDGLPPEQLDVLNNMFDPTSRNVLQWTLTRSVCPTFFKGSGWSGISCNTEGTSVVAIKIPANKVSGTLPPMAPLVDLVSLWLSQNSIVGEIPASLPASLNTLVLSGNYFTGTIPNGLEDLFLTSIDLSANGLSGTIPPVSNFTALQYFSLENNHLTGGFPEGIEVLRDLRVISLFNNKLSGVLPDLLGDPEFMPSLITVNVNGNGFTGQVPKGLSSSRVLVRIYLDTNDLTGKVPHFQSLDSGTLTKLTLANNRWSCPLPSINSTIWTDKSSTSCSGADLLLPLWLLLVCIVVGTLLLAVCIAFLFRRRFQRFWGFHSEENWDAATDPADPNSVQRGDENQPILEGKASPITIAGQGVVIGAQGSAIDIKPERSTGALSKASGNAGSTSQLGRSSDPTVSLFFNVTGPVFPIQQQQQEIDRSVSTTDVVPSPLPTGLLDSWNDPSGQTPQRKSRSK